MHRATGGIYAIPFQAQMRVESSSPPQLSGLQQKALSFAQSSGFARAFTFHEVVGGLRTQGKCLKGNEDSWFNGSRCPNQ